MKAKCPECNGKGCSKCNNGYMEVEFENGIYYDLICKKCKAVVGMHIDEGNDPPPDLKKLHGCCVFCSDPQDLEWVLSGVSK